MWPFVTEHWMFLFFAALGVITVLIFLFGVLNSIAHKRRTFELQNQSYQTQAARLRHIESLRYDRPDIFLEEAQKFTDSDWQMAKDLGLKVLTAVAPTERLQKYNTNKTIMEASKMGVPVETYVPLKTTEIVNDLDIEHKNKDTDRAIEAAEKLRATNDRRRLQASKGIAEMEELLNRTDLSKSERAKLKRDLQYFRDEYDRLSRHTISED